MGWLETRGLGWNIAWFAWLLILTMAVMNRRTLIENLSRAGYLTEVEVRRVLETDHSKEAKSEVRLLPPSSTSAREE